MTRSKRNALAGPSRRQQPDPGRPPGAGAGGDGADCAVVAAIRLQQQGRADEAAAAFRELQARVPDHPAVLHFGGLHAHREGRLDEALRAIRRSLELEPRWPDWWSNLGVVLKAAGRLEEAAAAYARALAIDPAHVNALINLGVAERARGRPEEAEAAYRNALSLAPGHAEAHANLRLLGNAYRVAGRREKAIEVFEFCVRDSPDDPVARHMLAACSGRDVPERASDAYVLATFDGFAESFDDRLAELGYRAPLLATGAVADAGIAPDGSLVVLDAGCGTGLCGPLLAPYAARLIGVDLSGAMLDRARGRGAYHELVERELTAHLEAHPRTYDLVVSADTLVYFGALERVVAAGATALRPGGHLVCTLEELAEDAPCGYRLQPHGRYAHRAAYVRQVATAAGLAPTIVRAQLRTEAGAPVAGLVVCAAAAGASCRTGADATRNPL